MMKTNACIERAAGHSRRRFLTATGAAALAGLASTPMQGAARWSPKAQIAITLDLEMSRHYPRRGMMEWDYQKGNLDEATKEYSVKAARLVKSRGGVLHFFLVGRVLEQKDITWLEEIAKMGHPIGNHTYDHVNVWATVPEKTQFRFQRAPWLIRGKQTMEVIRENIETTTLAMKKRAGLTPDGFRTPGGSYLALDKRPDLQRMLLDLGFKWISSKYPRHLSGKPKQPPGPEVYASIVKAQQQAQPYVYPTGLIEVPMSPISDVTAFRSHFWKQEYFLKAIRMAVEQAIETGGVFDFLAHPSCLVVEDPKLQTIAMICDLVNQAGSKAEIVGLSEIAKRATPASKSGSPR